MILKIINLTKVLILKDYNPKFDFSIIKSQGRHICFHINSAFQIFQPFEHMFLSQE